MLVRWSIRGSVRNHFVFSCFSSVFETFWYLLRPYILFNESTRLMAMASFFYVNADIEWKSPLSLKESWFASGTFLTSIHPCVRPSINPSVHPSVPPSVGLRVFFLSRITDIKWKLGKSRHGSMTANNLQIPCVLHANNLQQATCNQIWLISAIQIFPPSFRRIFVRTNLFYRKLHCKRNGRYYLLFHTLSHGVSSLSMARSLKETSSDGYQGKDVTLHFSSLRFLVTCRNTREGRKKQFKISVKFKRQKWKEEWEKPTSADFVLGLRVRNFLLTNEK